MRYLPDTQLLVWAAFGLRPLPKQAHTLFEDSSNDILFSVVTLWEVAIKSRLDKPDFQVDAALFRKRLLSYGYQELTIQGEHVLQVAHLPLIHGDPFDRLLVAQAISEGITLLTTDSVLAKYPAPVHYIKA